MRFLPMPVADVLDERFASPVLKAAIDAGGITASWLGPRSPESAFNLLLHRCGGCRGAIGYPRLARGGCGALSEALAASARAAGAEIRTEAQVTTIRVKKGATAGVVLAGGEEIPAATVLSTADPKTTLLDLVDPGHLEPSFLREVANIRCRGTVAMVHFALDRLPRFHGVGDSSYLSGRILIGPSLDHLEQAFDDAKYGRLPRRPFLDLTIPTLTDPSLAPKADTCSRPGYNTRLTSCAKRAGARRATTSAGSSSRPSPRWRRTLTPPSASAGCRPPGISRSASGLPAAASTTSSRPSDQLLYMRPVAGWARHATPIAGLYLGGAGSHGGGGLTGLAGRNAARVVLSKHDR